MNTTFLEELIMSFGVSGYETPASLCWNAYMNTIASTIDYQAEHNSYAHLTPKTADKPLIYLSAHIDEVGFVVIGHSNEGYIYFSPVDTNIFDITALRAKKVELYTNDGIKKGVIGHPPSHCLPWDPNTTAPQWTHLWIDVGAHNKKEAVEYAPIGTPLRIAKSIDYLKNNTLCSGALDNRISCYAIAEASKTLAGSLINHNLITGIHIHEEVDQRGGQMAAQHWKPHLNIVVDTTFALDHPEVDKRAIGDIALHHGPVITINGALSHQYTQQLITTAKEANIPHQIMAWGGKLPTDTFHMSKAHHGIPTILISIPLRYMHTTVEMVSLSDIQHTQQLIEAFIQQIDQS